MEIEEVKIDEIFVTGKDACGDIMDWGVAVSFMMDWGQFLNQPLRFHWGRMLCHLPCSSCQTHKELGEAGLTTQWCYLSRLDSKSLSGSFDR